MSIQVHRGVARRPPSLDYSGHRHARITESMKDLPPTVLCILTELRYRIEDGTTQARSIGVLVKRTGIAMHAMGKWWRRCWSSTNWREWMQPPERTPTIDLTNYRIVRADGAIFDLTRQEYRLLCALRDAGQLLTYEQIAQRAWGYECGYTLDGISACVRRLRRKLGDDPRCPRYLHNVRGVGYRLDLLPDRCVVSPSGPGGA